MGGDAEKVRMEGILVIQGLRQPLRLPRKPLRMDHREDERETLVCCQG